jgi:hypothetical protein
MILALATMASVTHTEVIRHVIDHSARRIRFLGHHDSLRADAAFLSHG